MSKMKMAGARKSSGHASNIAREDRIKRKRTVLTICFRSALVLKQECIIDYLCHLQCQHVGTAYRIVGKFRGRKFRDFVQNQTFRDFQPPKHLFGRQIT